eukprot:1866067-Prymnesium_polylepis.1
MFLVVLILLAPTTAAFAPTTRHTARVPTLHRACARACDSDDGASNAAAAAAAGLVANPVMWASLYSVATSGGGLPAGPFGIIGLTEGISYLVVVGFVGAALYKKATTGSGLPAGPAGLLGAAEGLSFLSVLAGLAVLALVATQKDCVPNALPLADYSGLVNVCR